MPTIRVIKLGEVWVNELLRMTDFDLRKAVGPPMQSERRFIHLGILTGWTWWNRLVSKGRSLDRILWHRWMIILCNIVWLWIRLRLGKLFPEKLKIMLLLLCHSKDFNSQSSRSMRNIKLWTFWITWDPKLRKTHSGYFFGSDTTMEAYLWNL